MDKSGRSRVDSRRQRGSASITRKLLFGSAGVLIASAGILAVAQSGNNYEIRTSVVANGGQTSGRDGDYTLSGTVAQPIGGPVVLTSTNGAIEVRPGFQATVGAIGDWIFVDGFEPAQQQPLSRRP